MIWCEARTYSKPCLANYVLQTMSCASPFPAQCVSWYVTPYFSISVRHVRRVVSCVPVWVCASFATCHHMGHRKSQNAKAKQ